MDQCVSAE